MTFLPWDKKWDALRSDPRCVSILARVGSKHQYQCVCACFGSLLNTWMLIRSCAVACVFASCVEAVAQDAGMTANGDALADRVVVTGSNIPTAEEVGPNPVCIERFAFDQLHRAIAALPLGRRAKLKNGRDIGMAQRRRGARFTYKTFTDGL